eukprot:9755331-Alexandrium_andersonii.AAC.1
MFGARPNIYLWPWLVAHPTLDECLTQTDERIPGATSSLRQFAAVCSGLLLSLIHISEPTRLALI